VSVLVQAHQRRFLIQIGISILLIYGISWNFTGPDLEDFLYPWLAHIRAEGPVHAFATPFSNYTPPYLYLLSLFSLFGLSSLATIKSLSIVICLWLPVAVHRLMQIVRPEKALEAAAISLLLPTVMINGPLLGQCDVLWVAPCLLTVAAALEKRTYAMAAWAGVSFAFKAQAIFIAPFALSVVLSERKWAALFFPPLVHLAAIAPAWLAGWPISDLLTIYVHQYQYLEWLSTAPNLWAPSRIAFARHHEPHVLFVLGYAATAVVATAYIWRRPRPLLPAALLCAILIPWFMPKMHERYFLLADILALVLAYATPRGALIFLCVLLGSVMSLVTYGTSIPAFNVLGSVFMTVALGLLLYGLGKDQLASTGLDTGEGESPCNAHKQSTDASGIVFGPRYQ
jgi:Gpi18-like mannosyltransferase